MGVVWLASARARARASVLEVRSRDPAEARCVSNRPACRRLDQGPGRARRGAPRASNSPEQRSTHHTRCPAAAVAHRDGWFANGLSWNEASGRGSVACRRIRRGGRQSCSLMSRTRKHGEPRSPCFRSWARASFVHCSFSRRCRGGVAHPRRANASFADTATRDVHTRASSARGTAHPSPRPAA
jgi:hypothetical protein